MQPFHQRLMMPSGEFTETKEQGLSFWAAGRGALWSREVAVRYQSRLCVEFSFPLYFWWGGRGLSVPLFSKQKSMSFHSFTMLLIELRVPTFTSSLTSFSLHRSYTSRQTQTLTFLMHLCVACTRVSSVLTCDREKRGRGRTILSPAVKRWIDTKE